MMKRIFLLLILLGCACFELLAQVSIKFENGKDKESVGFADLMDEGKRTSGGIYNGKAKLKLDVTEKSLLVFGYQREVYFLWGVPGQEYLFDCSKRTIVGGDKKIMTFLNDWQTNYFNIPENTLMEHTFYLTAQYNKEKKSKNMDRFLAPDYLQYLKDLQTKQMDMLKKVKYKDQDFSRVFSDFIYISYWRELIRATNLLRYYNHKVPVILLDEMLKMKVEQPGFVDKSYAKLWLWSYIEAMEDKEIIKPTLKDYVFKTASYFKNPQLREFYLLNQLESKVNSNSLIFFEDLFSSCASCVTTSEGKERFETLYNKGKALIAQNKFDGEPASELIFITVEGKKVALSDFAGKYVYIDIWATWCGPCKQETPHFLKLAERMQEKNIVFLSLSVDGRASEQAWKKYVIEHDLQKNCVAGWTGNGFRNSFITSYGIKGIPRFMLVGPDGNMIFHNCWRPSNVQIDELLNSFLK